MRENVSIPTKRSLRNNPEGTFGKEAAQKLRRLQEDARAIVKPILPTFHKTMESPVMVEIFSNIVVDDYLIDFLSADKLFAGVFALTYNKKSLYLDTPEDRQKIQDLVMNDQNAEYVQKKIINQQRKK